MFKVIAVVAAACSARSFVTGTGTGTVVVLSLVLKA